jgi:hypothetical protein
MKKTRHVYRISVRWLFKISLFEDKENGEIILKCILRKYADVQWKAAI